MTILPQSPPKGVNFIDLVTFSAETDDVLHTYLETAPRNALHPSETMQNQIVGNAIQDSIIKKIHAGKLFFLLCWLMK